VTSCIAQFVSPTAAYHGDYAITQTNTIFEQLCAGYRVFDLRFKDNNHNLMTLKDGNTKRQPTWRIFHGPSAVTGVYYFETMESIAQQVRLITCEGCVFAASLLARCRTICLLI
jgi:hypothetical protein